MIRELWTFFRRKLRKGNGLRWALAYAWDHYRWIRIRDDPDRYREWLK